MDDQLVWTKWNGYICWNRSLVADESLGIGSRVWTNGNGKKDRIAIRNICRWRRMYRGKTQVLWLVMYFRWQEEGGTVEDVLKRVFGCWQTSNAVGSRVWIHRTFRQFLMLFQCLVSISSADMLMHIFVLWLMWMTVNSPYLYVHVIKREQHKRHCVMECRTHRESGIDRQPIYTHP